MSSVLSPRQHQNYAYYQTTNMGKMRNIITRVIPETRENFNESITNNQVFCFNRKKEIKVKHTVWEQHSEPTKQSK